MKVDVMAFVLIITCWQESRVCKESDNEIGNYLIGYVSNYKLNDQFVVNVRSLFA